MNVAVDIGNTSIKIASFEYGNLINKQVVFSIKEVVTFLENEAPSHVIISNVGKEENIQAELGNKMNIMYLNPQLPLPIKNNYKNPETLGTDRLAAAVGAFALFPYKNCLSIDIGTCITYDFIDENGKYQGGSIAPGIFMKFKALHTFTARLPLIQPVGETALIGKTTQDSILSGVLNGTLAEIEGIIRNYSDMYNNLQVFFCGGDVKFFETRIKAPIFVIPDLVLIGLNRILEHNVQA